MAINAIEGSVELAFEEPGVVTVGEGAAVDGLEVFRPGEERTGFARPVLIGFGDGFFVEFLVFVETCGNLVRGEGGSIFEVGEGEGNLDVLLRWGLLGCSAKLGY